MGIAVPILSESRCGWRTLRRASSSSDLVAGPSKHTRAASALDVLRRGAEHIGEGGRSDYLFRPSLEAGSGAVRVLVSAPANVEGGVGEPSDQRVSEPLCSRGQVLWLLHIAKRRRGLLANSGNRHSELLTVEQHGRRWLRPAISTRRLPRLAPTHRTAGATPSFARARTA